MSADSAPSMPRQARHLLLALAEEGASARASSIRDGFVEVAKRRGGISVVAASVPEAAAVALVNQGLAQWQGAANAARLVITPEGAATARRISAAQNVDPFLAQHSDISRRRVDFAGPVVAVNDSESPVTWLARRKDRQGRPLIESWQESAAERLRRDVEIAQIVPRITSSWATPVSGSRRVGESALDITDMALAARQRVEQALDAVGHDVAGLLLDVCAFLKGLEVVERERRWPPRSAKIVLRMALDSLARHYGLAPNVRHSAATRHWGVADYRPAIDPQPNTSG